MSACHQICDCSLFNVQAAPHCSEAALICIADILARIASVEEGLTLLLYGENMNSSEEKRYVSVFQIICGISSIFCKSDSKCPRCHAIC